MRPIDDAVKHVSIEILFAVFLYQRGVNVRYIWQRPSYSEITESEGLLKDRDDRISDNQDVLLCGRVVSVAHIAHEPERVQFAYLPSTRPATTIMLRGAFQHVYRPAGYAVGKVLQSSRLNFCIP